MLRLVTLLLLTLLAAPVIAAPVPKSLKAKLPTRAKIEPRPGEKLYSVKFDNLPLKKVAELLDEETGLLCTSKEVPDLRVTLYTTEKVCVSELFAQLNDELVPKGYLLARKTASFSVLKVDAPLDPKCCPALLPKELERWSPEEPVKIYLPAFDEQAAGMGIKLAEEFTHKWFEVKPYDSKDSLLVMGRAADVQQFRSKFLKDTEPLRLAEKAKRDEMLRRLQGQPQPFRRPFDTGRTEG